MTTAVLGRDRPVVERYLELGLALGRHLDGLVDAYYGPPGIAARVRAAPLESPGALADRARDLLADAEAGVALGAPETWTPPARAEGAEDRRRRWLSAQVTGLRTTARRLAGETLSYPDEVEACYGVRPRPVPEDAFATAHERLGRALPGTGPLAERYGDWRAAHVVPPDVLPAAIASLAEDFRARTDRMVGLPDGERIDFELVTGQPWSGFNRYLGGLHSVVSVNTDMPVLSTSLPALVAHEAYPGHHTEHCRKEVGLVRRRRWAEETIFLVGTPQCLLAEGLADLGLEVLLGPRPDPVLAAHLRPLGVHYDADVVAEARGPLETLADARANAAWRLHVDGADPDSVVDELARWALLERPRAQKAVEFLLHPTWRAYITCYVEGLARCRAFVAGDPARFARLVDEQLLPADLVPAPGLGAPR